MTTQAAVLQTELDGLNQQLTADSANGDAQAVAEDQAQIATVSAQLAALNTPDSNGAPSPFLSTLSELPTDIGSGIVNVVEQGSKAAGAAAGNLLSGLTPTLILVGVGLIAFVWVAGKSGALHFARG